MLDIIINISLIIAIAAIVLILVINLIKYLADARTERINLNHETYDEFRTNCFRMVMRAIAMGFCISLEEITVEQSQADWDQYWATATFNDWIIWFKIDWRYQVGKMTCMYERNDYETFTKSFYFRTSHHMVNEHRIMNKLRKINDAAFKFALPNDSDKLKEILSNGYEIAQNKEVSDEQLFDIMYNTWSNLPFETKKDAENFIRITAFLARFHFEEMQKKTVELAKEMNEEKDQ